MRRYNYRYIATYKDENGNEEILFLDAAFIVDAKARAENFGTARQIFRNEGPNIFFIEE